MTQNGLLYQKFYIEKITFYSCLRVVSVYFANKIVPFFNISKMNYTLKAACLFLQTQVFFCSHRVLIWLL